MRYSNGERYEGEWLHGKKHGKGVFKQGNAVIYEGRFDHDAW